MIVSVKYLGFFPLGDDVELNGIKIMQKDWHEYKMPCFLLGRKRFIRPNLCGVFYTGENGRYAFFAAYEYGIGHYHIYTLSEKSIKKMIKKLKLKTI